MDENKYHFYKDDKRKYVSCNFNTKIKIGDFLRIDLMDGEASYAGRSGNVTIIDSLGDIHGTWGGLALVPAVDLYSLAVDEHLASQDDEMEA